MTAGVETALEVAVGLADARFFSPALTLCHSATAGVRALAATLLGALGGREGVEVLTALLDDDVPEVRAAAARALGNCAIGQRLLWLPCSRIVPGMYGARWVSPSAL